MPPTTDQRTRGTREADLDTRQRILAVSQQLFAQKGYTGTSMASIATMLGISAPALYWHFESKEALLYAIIEGGMEEFLGILTAPAGSAREQLDALVRTYTLYQLERSDEVRTHSSLMRQAQDGRLLGADRLEVIRTQQRRVYRAFADVITAGVEATDFDVPDVRVTAFAIINMCEYVSVWARPDREFDAQTVAGMNVELALRLVHVAR